MNADDQALRRLARQLARQCVASGCTLAVAESCTGGWIAKCLTDLAGSSRWFSGGVVSYSNAAKTDMLGVPAALIESKGAVSEAVARAMAEGILRASGVDCSLAVTGIAGPGGGSADKPVGTVWFAWAERGGSMRAAVEQFSGDREAVRRKTVARALEGLLAR